MYKLVVVDDENRIRDGILYSFPWNQLGYEIVADFESSLLALEYIRSNPVDVVLTDIKMPILDGVELSEKLKQMNPQIEIIFISGYRDFEYAKSAISLGVREYITKPFRREEVIGVFRRMKAELDQRNQDTKQNEEQPLYYDKIILDVKAYIHGQLTEASLEGAANEAGLSAGYLSKLFKQKTGLSFTDYLISCKMEQAAKLLTSTRMKSYEISELVGYDNPKNFSRKFREYYGISPREYREKGLSGR